MKPTRSLFLLICLFVNAACAQQDTSAAEAAAFAWLEFVDAQDYAASWEAAGSMFRDQLTADQWAIAGSAARDPLGALLQRTLARADATSSLPNVPPGDYVVVQTNAGFEQRDVTETIILVLEDAQWRVIGYYIR